MYPVVKLLQQQPHKIHHHFHLSEWYEVLKLLQQQPLSIPDRYHLIILKETKVLHNPVTCRIFYLDTNLSNPFPIVNMIPYLGTILLSLAIDNFRIRYVYYMQGSRFVVRYGRKGQGLIISSITRANRTSFFIFTEHILLNHSKNRLPIQYLFIEKLMYLTSIDLIKQVEIVV